MHSDEIVAAFVERFALPADARTAGDPLVSALCAGAQPRGLADGEVLVRRGEPARCFWLLRAGELVAAIDEEGSSAPRDGAFVGESALLHGRGARRAATLVARGEVSLVEFAITAAVRRAFHRSPLRDRMRALDREPRADAGATSWRTMLFLPQFAFAKAWQTEADCFVVDFQDAVPLSAKASARQGLRDALAAGDLGDRPIVVRINEAAVAGEQALDLDAVVGLAGVTAIMPTMIERPEELDELHAELLRRERDAGLPAGSVKLLPLIETPGAVLRLDALVHAGGGRNIGVFLGHGDLFRLTGTTRLDFSRSAVVFAARAAGIAAFDTPYTRMQDLVGLERATREARAHGFDGKVCVHRDQLAVVARCMGPAPDEVAWARRVEQARRAGRLATLQRKLEGAATAAGADRQTDGMALVDRQLVGPPHIKAAQRILAVAGAAATPSDGLRGRVVAHRSEREMAPGAELGNPYELTITDGMRDLWVQCFYSHDAAVTSRRLAARLGLASGERMPVPFMMALYLCVSMSNTHGAIYHLGFRDARQHAAIAVGDTVRQRIRMLRVRNTKDGARAVVTTLRELVRMDDDAVLFSTEKLELYRAQPAEFGAPGPAPEPSTGIDDPDELLASAMRGVGPALAERAHIPGLARPEVTLSAGDVLLHSFARPLGITANLALSTQFLVTHPSHLDHHQYDQGGGAGIVVSGGLVISLLLAAASRDLGHLVWQELLSANNVRPVGPGDTVSAVSCVLGRADLAGSDDCEVLLVKTIGVVNLTPARELVDVDLPRALFEPDVGGGGRYDQLCERHGLAALAGRIVGDALRRVVRIKPR